MEVEESVSEGVCLKRVLPYLKKTWTMVPEEERFRELRSWWSSPMLSHGMVEFYDESDRPKRTPVPW